MTINTKYFGWNCHCKTTMHSATFVSPGRPQVHFHKLLCKNHLNKTHTLCLISYIVLSTLYLFRHFWNYSLYSWHYLEQENNALTHPCILTLRCQVGSTDKENKVQFQEISSQAFHLKALRGMPSFTRKTTYTHG